MLKFTDQVTKVIANQVFIKLEYLNHKYISGNKFRKLKYNFVEAKKQKKDTIVTFGGAYSNHIAAVAAAGKEFKFKTIGIIRGEELTSQTDLNPTLTFARLQGMKLLFITREAYKEKSSDHFLQNLKAKYGDFYLIPEGGTNELAVRGCEEILTLDDKKYDYICCPVGTGGTISGLINASGDHQTVLGFPALKGDFLQEDISKFVKKDNWHLMTNYHFGGYAKINEELISFINQFKRANTIPLDPIYTGKMMYGVMDLLKKGFFKKDDRILAIHTGGLQGIEGMNIKLKHMNLPTII